MNASKAPFDRNDTPLTGAAANLRAMGLIVVGMGAFVVNDTLMKATSDELPLGQMIALRGVISCSIMLPIVAASCGLAALVRVQLEPGVHPAVPELIVDQLRHVTQVVVERGRLRSDITLAREVQQIGDGALDALETISNQLEISLAHLGVRAELEKVSDEAAATKSRLSGQLSEAAAKITGLENDLEATKQKAQQEYFYFDGSGQYSFI